MTAGVGRDGLSAGQRGMVVMPRAVTKSEAAYAEIRRRILFGVFLPGAAIDQERTAEEFGLSTTPVREALRRLEAEGWVSLEAHREARVRELTRRELDDLYQLRFELDPLAAGLACSAMTDADIESVRQVGMLLPAKSGRHDLDVNRELHRRIYVGSGNLVLVGMLDQLWDRCDRYRLVLLRSDPAVGKVATNEHREILETLAERKAARLRRLMREHLVSSYERLQALLPLE